MKVLVSLLLFLFLFPNDLLSQDFVNWRDLIDADVSHSYERIQVGADSLQFADLLLPDDDGPHPVVILVHGGCWLGIYPGVELTHPMAQALAKEGYAIWNIEYRSLGQEGGGYPGTFRDVANAADHLRGIADKYYLNLENVIVAGHSAGGHLAT